jgi:hypothetical protein
MEHIELNTHIMNSTKKTFFLTDLMKTGDHLRIETVFGSMHSATGADTLFRRILHTA